MPLRRSSTTSGSSVSLFQMGQVGQGFVRMGVPPRTAGEDDRAVVVSAPDVEAGAVVVGKGAGVAALSMSGPSIAPAAASPVARMKSLRPKFLFFMFFNLEFNCGRVLPGLCQYFG